MSNNRSALLDEYGRQQAETAEITAKSFYDMTQRTVQATLDWQKFLLGYAVRQSTNAIDIPNSILDAAARQSSAVIEAMEQQFDNSLTTLTTLTRRWFENVETVQDTFTSVVRRGTQEAPVPPFPKKRENPDIAYAQS